MSAESATAVVISSSPAAPSLSRGFSLSFQHQQHLGSTQGVAPSARMKRTNSLDFERLVPFNRETSQHFSAEKRSPSFALLSVAPPERSEAAGCSSWCVNNSTDSATKDAQAQTQTTVSVSIHDSLRSAGNGQGEEHTEKQRESCSTMNHGDSNTASAVPRALQTSPSLLRDSLLATKQQSMAKVDSKTPGALLCQNVVTVTDNVMGNVTAGIAAFSDQRTYISPLSVIRGGAVFNVVIKDLQMSSGTIANSCTGEVAESRRQDIQSDPAFNIVIKDLQMSSQGAATTGSPGFQANGNATQLENEKATFGDFESRERTSDPPDDHKLLMTTSFLSEKSDQTHTCMLMYVYIVSMYV